MGLKTNWLISISPLPSHLSCSQSVWQCGLMLLGSYQGTKPDCGGQMHKAIQNRKVPLYYHKHLGMANLKGQEAGSDLAKLYRIVLASTEIQRGTSWHSASWQDTMVNTYHDSSLKPCKWPEVLCAPFSGDDSHNLHISWMFSNRNRRKCPVCFVQTDKAGQFCSDPQLSIFNPHFLFYQPTIHPPSILSIFVLSGGSSFLAFCQRSDGRATYARAGG